MPGPTSALALDGDTITQYLDTKTIVKAGGFPKRQRTYLNKTEMAANDRRTVARWRTGKTATKDAFVGLLASYGLTLRSYKAWCKKAGIAPTLRGEL